MSATYEIQPLSAASSNELEDVYRRSFGRDVPKGYFDWKYQQNPAGNAVGRVARAEDGSIAAAYSMIPMRFTFAGEEMRVLQSCDSMTCLSHRRQGLFGKLATESYECEIKKDSELLVVGFTNLLSTFEKIGWSKLGEFGIYFKPRHLTIRWGPSKNVHQCEMNDVLKYFTTSSIEGCQILDRDLFEWKFRNPNRNYYYFKCREGISVASLKNRELLLHYWPKNKTLLRAHIQTVAHFGKKHGALFIKTFASAETQDAETLKQVGFMRNPTSFGPASEKSSIIGYARGEKSQKTLDAKLWKPSMLDLDSY